MEERMVNHYHLKEGGRCASALGESGRWELEVGTEPSHMISGPFL